LIILPCAVFRSLQAFAGFVHGGTHLFGFVMTLVVNKL
jgi:hypothetical protein